MSLSSALYELQQLDTGLDRAHRRIQEIDIQLNDRAQLDDALEIHRKLGAVHDTYSKALEDAEHEVALQNTKLESNQKKLYSGVVTNPKELEDLQLESNSLTKYLAVLEERLLQAMLEADQSRADLDAASARVDEISTNMELNHQALKEEKNGLESEIESLASQRSSFLDRGNPSGLSTYESLRKSSGGIAVTLMAEASCSSCGANIPSAIEQEAKSPTKLAFCPTCSRILHPE